MKLHFVQFVSIAGLTLILASPSLGLSAACQTEIDTINQTLTDMAPALTAEIEKEVARLRDLGQDPCEAGYVQLGLATLTEAKKILGIQST